MLRLNTLTRQHTTVSTPDYNTVGWMVDQQGGPGVATSGKDGRKFMYYRDGEGAARRKVPDRDAHRSDHNDFDPAFCSPDGTL